MADGMSLDGLQELIARVERAREDLLWNAGRAAYQLAEEIMTDSKEIVPVDKGILMNSGYVPAPVVQGSLITVELGYGGAAAPYAATVHEMMDGHVHWTRPGSGPKYLETPFKAKQGLLPERVADSARESFKG